MIWVLCIVALAWSYPAQADEREDFWRDSVEFSVLTCSAHPKIYALYGHSALRYQNKGTGQDFSFNYGLFNYEIAFFQLRFLLGLTDYQLGIIDTKAFCNEYQRRGCLVIEQKLNLLPHEKERLLSLLWDNLKPENRVYRYNFFYNNCTTKIRDIVNESLDSKIFWDKEPNAEYPTYRELIHECTNGRPWAALGNDLCLGMKADRKADFSGQQFLPQRMMADLELATTNGRKLISETSVLVPAGVQMVESDFPLTPTEVALCILCIVALLTVLEWQRKKTFLAVDLTLMTVSGILGCLVLLLFFSQHPTTSTNLLILMFNPLPLFYLHKVWKRQARKFWIVWGCGIVLYLACSGLQDYAEGTIILALVLLSRTLINIYSIRPKLK